MEGTSLDFYSEIVDSVNDDGTEDKDGTEDDTDDDDVGKVCLLPSSQQTVNGEGQ